MLAEERAWLWVDIIGGKRGGADVGVTLSGGRRTTPWPSLSRRDPTRAPRQCFPLLLSDHNFIVTAVRTDLPICEHGIYLPNFVPTGPELLC